MVFFTSEEEKMDLFSLFFSFGSFFTGHGIGMVRLGKETYGTWNALYR